MKPRTAWTLAASVAALTSLTGCPNREVSAVAIEENSQERKVVPVEVTRELDILFVIDNSDSMKEEQTSLADNFPRFIEVLEGIEGGLPDIRIGVVSTDMGLGRDDTGDTTCVGTDGDEGQLQRTLTVDPEAPAVCRDGSITLEEPFLANSPESPNNPDDRVLNYTGDLSDAFSCIARLGTTGCRFEQPLEAMRQALDPELDRNPGFLRDNAFLAVVIISDEDDCSAKDSELFDSSQRNLDDALGPFVSFRCFEFGVQCDPDDPRSNNPDGDQKTDCKPRDNSPYMHRVGEYVDFLKDLKGDERKVVVAGIIGVDEAGETPVTSLLDYSEAADLNFYNLGPACSSASGDARPGVRLKYFIDQFEDRGTLTTICKEDLTDALVLVANLLRRVVGNPRCFDANVDVDGDDSNGLQYDCQVSDMAFNGDEPIRDTEVVLHECSNGNDTPDSEKPCWFIQESPECELEPNQELVVLRTQDPPAGTSVVANCVLPPKTQ